MEEDLRAHFAANAGIANLVGQKIQWAVREGAPSIALHLIAAPPDQVLKGPSGLIQSRVQVDCWGVDFLSAKAIGAAVEAGLPVQGQIIGATKFLNSAVIDTERPREGESPNILFRTRLDLRVSYKPA